MKKQTLHTFIMGAFLLFSVYLYFLSATPLSAKIEIKTLPLLHIKDERKKALLYLNQLRQGAGLVPFSSQKQLNNAAQNHANYLTNHTLYGHKEEPKYKDFTGEYASSRITYAGYATSQVIENVSTLNPNYKESIDGLFSAIYHRFAFLDFRSDAIGIGISQNKKDKAQTAFVYDMSANALEKLYRSKTPITNGTIEKALQANKYKNSDVIIYPFNKQKDVPPAFFDELPDPLPSYKVSGFPISVSFNPSIYKTGKLLNFRLFNQEGKEIKNTLKINKQRDPNHRLGKLDFVLFPLERLEWNQTYFVEFIALIDHKKVKKRWNFHTKRFNLPFHTVKNPNTNYKMRVAQSTIFYFPPHSKNDLLHDIRYPANFDITFIDKNTIKLKVLAPSHQLQTLHIAKYKINIKISK
jgi:uncharacterized protein YkwD